MGIQDRDYYREGSGRFFEAWGRQGATVWLIVITSVIFFVQCLSKPPWESPLVEIGCYSYPKIVEGEVWRLLTPLFLHGGLWHFFFNMLVLYWAGTILEELYGSREFLAFYLLGGCLRELRQPRSARKCLGVTATWNRRERGRDGDARTVRLPLSVAAGIHLVHSADARVGLGRGLRWARWTRCGGNRPGRHRVYRPPRWRTVRGAVLPDRDTVHAAVLAVAPRTRGESGRSFASFRHPNRTTLPNRSVPLWKASRDPKKRLTSLDAKVDQVLAKVSKHGQESLTPEEREILFKASELYKKRRK